MRYSSIRPDLPKILEELKESEVKDYSRFLFTTDGSTPAFYKNGVIDNMIAIAIEKGVPVIDAYEMASYNVARHYSIDDQIGMVAPGRIAHLNILDDTENPLPSSVLAKGKWVLYEGECRYPDKHFSWEEHGVYPFLVDWTLTEEDLTFSMPMGLELVNSVILKPYQVTVDATQDVLSSDHDESYFIMIDRHGKWRINTVIKGFATNVQGFATTYSNTGDVVLIGKSKKDMLRAFKELKTHNGGMFLVENDEVVMSMPLTLFGAMSLECMENVMEQHEQLEQALKERGYPHDDPIYSVLFFSSTHLPYIRVTQKGIYDVHKKSVLFPSIMR